ncbi:hypothetical protein [Pseudomonas mangiferae]|uniref:Uncharacterized protein n=1 Tax=Pseudomonas mangiferae TaxID=2593654 RepID=A0A553GW49_9PSED|nr:hypothetical protein [Pseudomonas mangiferae]TRX73715.1 hypothetical protein FM069_16410 [Pseudomonas mangiferae]
MNYYATAAGNGSVLMEANTRCPALRANATHEWLAGKTLPGRWVRLAKIDVQVGPYEDGYSFSDSA